LRKKATLRLTRGRFIGKADKSAIQYHHAITVSDIPITGSFFNRQVCYTASDIPITGNYFISWQRLWKTVKSQNSNSPFSSHIPNAIFYQGFTFDPPKNSLILLKTVKKSGILIRPKTSDYLCIKYLQIGLVLALTHPPTPPY
jgi:hypothetical protein